MADQTPQGKIRELALQISQLDVEKLIHPNSAGSYDFEAKRGTFGSIQVFYMQVAEADLDLLPGSVLQTMFDRAVAIDGVLKSIQEFDHRRSDPNQETQRLSGLLTTTWWEAYNSGASHLTYARMASAAISRDFERTKTLVNNAMNDFSVELKKFSERSEELARQTEARISKLDTTIQAAREASKAAGVAEQAVAFDEEATIARDAAMTWLLASGAAVALGLFLVWAMFIASPESWWGKSFAVSSAIPPTADPRTVTALLIQHGVARVLVVTLVYAAVVWCARNYFASRHNFTVNRHRRNAMQTFRAFVAGTDDKATQDFILRQAAQCAFSPQQTGYLKDEALPTPGPASQVIDVIKPDGKT